MADKFKEYSYEKLKRFALHAKKQGNNEVALAAAKELRTRKDEALAIRERIESEGQIEATDDSIAGFLTSAVNVAADPLFNALAKSGSGLYTLAQAGADLKAQDTDTDYSQVQADAYQKIRDFLPSIDTEGEKAIAGSESLITQAIPENIKQSATEIGGQVVGTYKDVIGDIAEESLLAATAISTPIEALPDALTLTGAGQTAAIGKTTAKNLFTRQSKAKQKIAQLLLDGDDTSRIARYEIDPRDVKEVTGIDIDTSFNPLKDSVQVLDDNLRVGMPRVRTDKQAVNAIKNGFDETTIGMIKGSTPQDADAMLDMVNIVKQGKIRAKSRALDRPFDVAGKSLYKRVRHIMDVNKNAGEKVRELSKSLRGQPIDVEDTIDDFYDYLNRELYIVRGDDGLLDFSESVLSDNKVGQEAINKALSDLRKIHRNPDAGALHILKKKIDDKVTFGNAPEGMAGETEKALKGLRFNIRTKLDDSFPEYGKANKIYSETIDAIDSLQDVGGKRLNLRSGNAEKKLGSLSRRYMSRAASREDLIDSVNKLDGIAKKYGGEFDDDLLGQTIFADDLEKMFKAQPSTGFESGISKGAAIAADAATGGKAGLITKGAKKIDELTSGSEEAAFDAIETFLKKEANR